MPCWEYRRVTLSAHQIATPELEEHLNALGRQGWELVATLAQERHGYTHEAHFIFRKSIQGAVEP